MVDDGEQQHMRAHQARGILAISLLASGSSCCVAALAPATAAVCINLNIFMGSVCMGARRRKKFHHHRPLNFLFAARAAIHHAQ